jgi:hypothetical protein
MREKYAALQTKSTELSLGELSSKLEPQIGYLCVFQDQGVYVVVCCGAVAGLW